MLQIVIGILQFKRKLAMTGINEDTSKSTHNISTIIPRDMEIENERLSEQYSRRL